MGCWCSTAAEGGAPEKRPTQVAKEGKKEGKKHGDNIVKDGNKIVVSFDQKYAGRIIGKKGATIKGIEHKCPGVHIHIDTKSRPATATITGKGDRERALKLIQKELKHAYDAEDYEGPEGRRLRAKADEYAKKRSKLYEESQKAYKRHDGAAAKKYSEEAKKTGREMHKYNEQAAKVIFERRNKGKPILFIDLHGLTVKEALSYLEERLNKLLANDVDDSLHCVTGAGHHSPGHLAKIKPAVHDLIIKMKLRYEVENVGEYIIHC